MALVLSIFLCLTTGYLVVAVGWARRASRPTDFFLRASLSAGYGLGVSSIAYFIARAGEFSLLTLDLFALALPLFLLSWRRKPVIFAGDVATSQTSLLWPLWLRRTVAASFVLALCAAIYSAIRLAISHPHGDGWDAFAIWNLHARFLFRGGAQWRDGFSALIPWSHPDYPLLLPAAIAHFWTFLGHEDMAVPALIGLAFTFSTIGLLVSSLALLRGSTVAMLGGLTLLSTPFFVEQGAAQYADVPASFFVLATIVLLALYDRPAHGSTGRGFLVLAGLGAGFAAWTKNEGLLFVLSILAARLLERIVQKNHSHLSRRRNAGLLILISFVPALLLIAWFKHSVAPASELFSNPGALHKLLVPSRYGAILQWYGKAFLRFGEWTFIPGTLLLVGFYLAANRRTGAHHAPGTRASAIAVGLTLAGYFVIYLITPYDLYWHLRFSLNRLFLQLWPSVIFLFFLAFAPPQKRASL